MNDIGYYGIDTRLVCAICGRWISDGPMAFDQGRLLCWGCYRQQPQAKPRLIHRDAMIGSTIVGWTFDEHGLVVETASGVKATVTAEGWCSCEEDRHTCNHPVPATMHLKLEKEGWGELILTEEVKGE